MNEREKEYGLFNPQQNRTDKSDNTHLDRIELLQKKLKIAKKALERYSKDDYYGEGGGRSVNPYPHIAREALKEIDSVGTSTKEE